MTLAIDATIGGRTSNSFVTEVEAIAFAATRLNLTGWTTVTGTTCTPSEIQALIEATRELSVLSYQGYRTDVTQALGWPRLMAVNPDATSSCYALYDATVIPQRVKDATCEFAIAFLAAGTTDIAGLDSTTGIIEKTVDVLTTRWAAPSQRPQGLARFPRVMRQIAPLLTVGPGQARLVR